MRIPKIKIDFNSRRAPGSVFVEVTIDDSPVKVAIGFIIKVRSGVNQGAYECITAIGNNQRYAGLAHSLNELPVSDYDAVKRAVIDLFAKVKEDDHDCLYI